MNCHRHLWLGVIAGCFLSFALQANPKKTGCEDRLVELRLRTVWRGLPLLELPPQSERFLIGALIETRDEEPFLAVGGYRTRHQVLDLALATMQDMGEISPFLYRWMGELHVTNRGDEMDVGRIEAINEMAGLFPTIMNTAEHENSIDNFIEIVNVDYEELLVKKVRCVPFCESEKEPHLMPDLNALVRDLEKLKQKNPKYKDDTYRHFIGNRMQLLLEGSQRILNDHTKFDTQRKKMKALKKLFETKLAVDSLELYLKWLENDGETHESIPRLRKIIHKLKKNKVKDIDFWWNFWNTSESFMTYFFRPNGDAPAAEEEVSIEEWMAVGGLANGLMNYITAGNDSATAAGNVQIISLE